MEHKPENFALSEADNERIYRERVSPRYFRDGMDAPADPKAVILGGQPGDGKTSLLRPSVWRRKSTRFFAPATLPLRKPQ